MSRAWSLSPALSCSSSRRWSCSSMLRGEIGGTTVGRRVPWSGSAWSSASGSAWFPSISVSDPKPRPDRALRARRHEQSRRRRHSRGRTSLARFLPPADLPFPGGHPLQDHDVSARRPRRATKHRSPAPPGRRPSTRRRTCRQRAQRAQTRENPARTCELTVRLVRPLNLLRCEPFGGSRGIPRASVRRNMRPTRYPAVRETVVRTGGQRAVLRRPSDPTKCRDRESVTSMALRSRPVAPSIILSTPPSTRPSICAQAVDRTASLLRSITLRIRRVTLSEPFLPS